MPATPRVYQAHAASQRPRVLRGAQKRHAAWAQVHHFVHQPQLHRARPPMPWCRDSLRGNAPPHEASRRPPPVRPRPSGRHAWCDRPGRGCCSRCSSGPVAGGGYRFSPDRQRPARRSGCSGGLFAQNARLEPLGIMRVLPEQVGVMIAFQQHQVRARLWRRARPGKNSPDPWPRPRCGRAQRCGIPRGRPHHAGWKRGQSPDR